MYEKVRGLLFLIAIVSLAIFMQKINLESRKDSLPLYKTLPAMIHTQVYSSDNKPVKVPKNTLKGTKTQQNPRSTNRPNCSKQRSKALLADTIGQSLCAQQNVCLARGEVLKTSQTSNAFVPHINKFLSVPLAPNGPITPPPSSASSFSEAVSADHHYTTSSNGSIHNLHDVPSLNSEYCPPPQSRVVSPNGNARVEDVERLAILYGQASHMGLLDPSYQVFVNMDCTGGLCFKVLSKVAIVMGDPLCEPSQIANVLCEFKQFRRQRRWKISFLGAGECLVDYAKRRDKRWTILDFGKERVLNPCTNSVVQETAGKRILTQVRQLLNPTKGGLTLGIYTPSLQGTDYTLKHELRNIYDNWRMARNQSGKPQAFITEYDPFLIPSLMSYIYTRDKQGEINGLAALRWIDSKNGYHLDPCIAAPTAPQKGITDLLLFASISWSRQQGVTYLNIGYEPSQTLDEVSGSTPASIARLTRRIYRHAFQRLPLGGKQAYFEKFKPDGEKDAPLFLVFPSRIPEPRHVVAVAHAANISIRKLLLNGRKG
ncbi:hypothetical protein BJY04DRAFT_184602 [Aspergillus karnatakaensis]|uniref:protein ergS n=1 Tax=Aspergillus karnatakaensis TaxID=1810916 RepID=UPI003CCCF235